MDTMAFTDFSGGESKRRHALRRDPPVAVQILSILCFCAFSIVAIALAFTAFWVAGFIVTLVIAWTWARSRTFGGRKAWAHAAPAVGDLTPSVGAKRSSGNASFDAYRTETLERLERESRDFEAFLARLREARDAMEFDQFMDERARQARDATPKHESADEMSGY